MTTSTEESSEIYAKAQKLAAEKAEEAAKLLHSFAASLNSLDELTPPARQPSPTPRNWWKSQAGRFKDDPTFAEFVANVQAARKQEG